jgi:hypothetical protein
MYISSCATITTTGSAQKVLGLPANSRAELKAVILSNGATSTARVIIRSGDGTAPEDYNIIVVRVPAGGNVVLDEKQLRGFVAIKDIYVVTDQQPLDVCIAVDAM